jgi:ribosomal protein S18 acetylase RimI-like enzyme
VIRLRPYADADLPPAQAALAEWARAAGPCGYCHAGELAQRIYAGLAGKRPLGAYVQVWEDGLGLVGLAICGRFGADFDLFVAPGQRGGAAELAMLERAAATAARLAGGAPEVISDVFGCDTVRQELLARLGFAAYRRWDDIVARDLAEPIPPPQLPAGFRIRPAAAGDYAQLAVARNAAFGSAWTPELYRDAVMGSPGYRPEREIVVLAPDDAIVAFTALWLDGLNRAGQLEPVGTVPAFQRRGLARAMLCHALAELRRLGMATAIITYDATNLAAAALYCGLGFRTVDETLGYRRAG